MQELIRCRVIQLGSEDLHLFPVPSCVYPRKHFCLVGSESPRSGSPSPACCGQEGEREQKGSVAVNSQARKPSLCTWDLGHFAVQCSGFGLQRKKSQVEVQHLVALV